jgi:hypothetical protein
MKRIAQLLVWCLMAVSVTQVLAQGADCPTIVQSALAATDQLCSTIGRNQACYGNLNLQAVPQPGVNDLNFNKPGDLVDVGSVQSLNLSPLDTTGKTWGVALMKIQANLPDTLPGQNVTFLLFGNVEIDNAVGASGGGAESASGGTTLSATVSSMTPLMESITDPSKIKMLNNGTKVTLDGYDKTTQMVHAMLDDGTAGWTPSQSLKVEGDVTTLPAMSMLDAAMPKPPTAASAAPTQTPMQAFYFKTGTNDAPCTEAPDSGILIQTPEGAGKISLTMNGVDVTLGSTAYVQAAQNPDGKLQLDVNVVEGDGLVKSQGVSRDVPAGTHVTVPLKEENNHLTADGAPGDVQPYDNTALAALPVSHLERKISVAPALTADQIAALTSQAINMQGGTWQIVYSEMTASGACPEGTALGLSYANGSMQSVTIQMPDGPFNPQGITDTSGSNLPPGTTFTNSSPNDFTMSYSESGSSVQYEMHVISPSHVDLLVTTTDEGGCIITIPGSMDPVG